ncbi:PqqD family protein [Bacteroides sp. 519]|uniref:PqqD family protein n=1 Tax=Bacteroides sp. 519 TaxID=2302937 RepID=UPI0013D74A7F|nr:PqqD family protein [Bacteroides sp. 519]NDV59161.1 PqqD family protein [Bacteroides sp. 519]
MKQKYNLLDVIPYIAEHIVTKEEDGLIVIAFLRFKSKWVNKYLLPKGMSPYIHVRLEERGTEAWKLIDGVRTVQEITELLANYFTEEEDYKARVAAFISQLRKDGFIKYRVKAD